jgi:hypothetical protein
MPRRYSTAPLLARLVTSAAGGYVLYTGLRVLHKHEGAFHWPDVVLYAVVLAFAGALLAPQRTALIVKWAGTLWKRP